MNIGRLNIDEAGIQPEDLDDRIQCHHCGRYFNSIASDRHMAICAEKAKRKAIISTNSAFCRYQSRKVSEGLQVEEPKILPQKIKAPSSSSLRNS